MAEPVEMKIRLSREAEQIVKDAVEYDEYASPDAFVEEAVRLWQTQKEDRLIEAIGGVEVVRKLIEEADESGPSKPFDIEKIKAEARRRAIARVN